ncbi:hypothetical protein F7725_017732 [Dissostichus mawsoni]|uniref:Uncharacterized protein n=1 Tax=Dissostichus mawsoni TaxID=36200 RepID=A0A7J5XPF9_DISMA|nr:hypothetical protein F7725_017732 [Dissostichus mawsoni]
MKLPLCQLHLPHSETEDALLLDGLLSVVHITDEGLSILEPLEVTPTHVVVKGGRSKAKLCCSYDPGREEQILDVLLLPKNVLEEEVADKQGTAVPIKTSSDCELVIAHSYSVHCDEGFHIQPESKTFDSSFGPDYPPIFEVFLMTSTERVILKVQDQGGKEVWTRRVPLEAESRVPAAESRVPAAEQSPSSREQSPSSREQSPSSREQSPSSREQSPSSKSRVPAESRVPADQWLRSVRTELIQRVSQTTLNDLLDKLFDSEVISDSEMDSARKKSQNDGAREGAREVVDVVRRKGAAASRAANMGFLNTTPLLVSIACKYLSNQCQVGRITLHPDRLLKEKRLNRK